VAIRGPLTWRRCRQTFALVFLRLSSAGSTRAKSTLADSRPTHSAKISYLSVAADPFGQQPVENLLKSDFNGQLRRCYAAATGG
jgi:hypothetical protein